METLKKTFIYGLMVLGLSLGLTISALASDNVSRTKLSAEQGDAIAQTALGSMYITGQVVRQDYVKAFYWHQKAADQGYAAGQATLGMAYYYGQGVRQDYAKAFYWEKKAADQGFVYAQYMVGALYEFGEGVRQNNRQAKEWFGKACDNGYQDGCDSYRKLNQQRR